MGEPGREGEKGSECMIGEVEKRNRREKGERRKAVGTRDKPEIEMREGGGEKKSAVSCSHQRLSRCRKLQRM